MTDYGHRVEVVVHDQRDALYGGTRRLVAYLPSQTGSLNGSGPEAALDLGPVSLTEAAPAPSATPVLPARTGPGSSRGAWAEYARALDLTVSDGLSRDQLIALVEGRQEE